MPRVALIHWKAEEGKPRLEALRRAGFDARLYSAQGGKGLEPLLARPPDAFVIDLSRLPSHGRHVGVFFRQTARTRRVPLVFVDGEPAKVAAIRAALPDATFTTWRAVRGALSKAIASPAATPIVPKSIGGYSGTPLPKKLGVRASTTLALIGAPDGFEQTLGALPEGVTVRRDGRAKSERAILFVRSKAELERRFDAATRSVAGGGSLWLAWPKKTGPLAGDLGEADVRGFGLAMGWVDYKICAIDDTWSGLCFSRRQPRS